MGCCPAVESREGNRGEARRGGGPDRKDEKLSMSAGGFTLLYHFIIDKLYI